MSASVPSPVASPPQASGRRFVYLFGAQVLMLVLSPFLIGPGWPMLSYRLIGLAIFLSAIFALRRSRAVWIVASALALPALTLNAILAFYPDGPLLVPTLLCTAAFLVFSLVSLSRAVVSETRVTSDTIYGAISVYLLIALTFAVLYSLLEALQPGALQPIAARHPRPGIDWDDCVFYSFVTLTSLGYGDIVPITAHARYLSVLEAVGGIMYVAILIARLVGLYSAEKRFSQ